MMKQKINIGDYTIYGCYKFNDFLDEFYPIFENHFDNMDYEYDYDDLWMELFIDYAPDYFYDENDNRVERDCLFTIIVKNDMSEIHYIWDCGKKYAHDFHARTLYISDNGFGYTVNDCIDESMKIYSLPIDVYMCWTNMYDGYVY